MDVLLQWLVRIGDKVGALGALVATMGCAMCFPALASIGAALGLGFLSQWEGLFVNTLLPVFAWTVLILHALGWFAHRQWHRALAGMAGPVLLLLSLYPWFQYGWGTWVTYGALALMVAVAVWDLVSPANRHCGADDQCANPTAGEVEQ
jgi:mercuric ion transport protein